MYSKGCLFGRYMYIIYVRLPESAFSKIVFLFFFHCNNRPAIGSRVHVVLIHVSIHVAIAAQWIITSCE